MTIETNTEGVNARLDYGVFEAYNSIIYYVAMFVSGLGLAVAVVAAGLGYKMIGFEICLPIQVTYFALILLEVPQAAISSLFGLTLSSGYNQLRSFAIRDNLSFDKGLVVLQKQPYFLDNCNFTYIPLIALFVAAGVSRAWVPEKKEEPAKKVVSELKKKEKEVVVA